MGRVGAAWEQIAKAKTAEAKAMREMGDAFRAIASGLAKQN